MWQQVTANINALQDPKTIKQCEIPTIPDLVISKVLVPQFNITADFVHSHCSLLYDDCPGLPTNIMPHILQCIPYDDFLLTCTGTCPKCQNIKIQYYILFS
jgi:hypothetical protein